MGERNQQDGEQINEEELESVNGGGLYMQGVVRKWKDDKPTSATGGAAQN
ncbi:MAG: hypothetical protein WA988_03280 [Candidatus Nanopelagicales bacterium]